MRQETGLSLRNQILLAFFAIFGISLKPFISPIANIITDPLHVMGGSTSGGIYMMILVLARRIIGYKYSATYVGFIQGVLSIFLGISSFHGVLAIIIYTVPGIMIDYIFTLSINEETKSIAGCIIANISGSLITNALFFQVPFLSFSLMIMLGISSAYGGGMLSNHIYARIKKAIRV